MAYKKKDKINEFLRPKCFKSINNDAANAPNTSLIADKNNCNNLF